jgi:hypothetical protein
MKATIYDMARHYLLAHGGSTELDPNGWSKLESDVKMLAEFAKEVLTSYNQFLLKKGYTDLDIIEEPSAIDQFLK